MYCYNCMKQISDDCSYCSYCGHPTAIDKHPHHLNPGTTLNNRYFVGNAIGEDVFGITYVGLDTVLDRKIAIKEFYPSNLAGRNNALSNAVNLNNENERDYFRKSVESFLQEAKSIAEFHDEKSIVDVISFFEENNTAYVIMEYIDGELLSERIRSKGTYEPLEIFRSFIPVMTTLDKMHRKGIFHRNICPDNIFVLPDGSLKLINFGSERYFAGINKKTKPGYTPIEQYNQNGQQGPWTDVYGMCAAIYKCITGITPADSLERIQNDSLKRPSSLGIKINEPLENTLMYGMGLYPENRCRNMLELKNAVENQLYFSSVTPAVAASAVPPVIANATQHVAANTTPPDVTNTTIPSTADNKQTMYADKPNGNNGIYNHQNQTNYPNPNPNFINGQNYYTKPKKKAPVGMIIGLSLGGIALIVIIAISAIGILNFISKGINPSPNPNPAPTSSSNSEPSTSSSTDSSNSYSNSDDYSSSESSNSVIIPKPKIKTGYKEYNCDKLSICVPDEYIEKRSSPNYYYYNAANDFIYVHVDDLDGSNLSPLFLDSYIAGLQSKSKNFNMIKKEATTFAGKSGYHLEYSLNISDTDCYLNSYMVQHGDQLYTVTFTTRGFSQSSEFNKIEQDVLDMLYFEY